MDKYIIVRADDSTMLQERVNAQMLNGYIPLGGVTTYGVRFAQAMLLEYQRIYHE